MNLFDKLVTQALKSRPEFSSLRMVVEKELLHHDILNTLSKNNLLKSLTFIGGTCLRYCYGGERLSEDLDFTGGADFSKASLSLMADTLIESLQSKYGFSVNVSEPFKDDKNVSTWKIKIVTRAQSKSLPAQRINIDICALTSYEKRPMLLLNPYSVDMGTRGLILQAQSREEIYTDKLIAFALRPNRIKYRDLWDIFWLQSQGLKPNIELLLPKLSDRVVSHSEFLELFHERTELIQKKPEMFSEFAHEMQRFLPPTRLNELISQEGLWDFIGYLMEDWDTQIRKKIS